MIANTKYYLVGLVLLLMIGSFFSHFEIWNSYPQGIHSWAQSDRFALSLRYYEDLNFFNPRTFVLTTEDGKVGVEFPIVPFISAAIARGLQLPEYLPFIFKIINLLILFFGFVQIYLAFIRSGTNRVSMTLITALWFFTPVLLYYSFNFLPDSASLGFCLAGLAQYLRYLDTEKTKYFYAASFWLTLGSMIKLPVMIYLIAILIHFVWRGVLRGTKSNTLWMAITLACVCIGVTCLYDYFFLIKRNKDLWSVVFMSSPNPILNFKDFGGAIRGMFYWRTEYLTLPQILLLGAVFVLSVANVIKKKTGTRGLSFLFLIVFFGLICYFVGLGKQLANHDYYFISSFYPAIIFFTSAALVKLPGISQKWLTGVLLLSLISAAAISIPKARERWDDVYHIRKKAIENSIGWMKGGGTKLDTFQIPGMAGKPIFVLYDYAPNTSLIYFNRKGIVFNHEEMSRKEPHLEYWLERVKPVCFVVQGIWEEQLKRDKPEIYKTWEVKRFDSFIVLMNPSDESPGLKKGKK